MLLRGWLDGVVVRNQVTGSLMAITVIIVGVVNCFLLGLMRWGAGAIQLGRLKVVVGVLGETEGEWGSQNGRREQAMECGIELSVQVMIRRRRCDHVRNEFHAC